MAFVRADDHRLYCQEIVASTYLATLELLIIIKRNKVGYNKANEQRAKLVTAKLSEWIRRKQVCKIRKYLKVNVNK